MKLFLGIDASLGATGISLINEDYKVVELDILSTPTRGVERLYHLEIKFLSILDKYKKQISLAIIEGGAYREEGRIYDLGMWAGIIQLNLFKSGIDCITVAPLQLKKYVTGRGKSEGKQIIMLDIFKHWKEEIRDDNKADAYVLSRIAHDYFLKFRKNEKLVFEKYQEEVLKKLYKENDDFKLII